MAVRWVVPLAPAVHSGVIILERPVQNEPHARGQLGSRMGPAATRVRARGSVATGRLALGELALNTRGRDAVVAGTARDPRFLVAYLQDDGSGYEGAIIVYGARPDGTVVGPERVLDAFTRASASNPVATSARALRSSP